MTHIEVTCRIKNKWNVIATLPTRTQAKLIAKQKGWDEATNIRYFLIKDGNRRQIRIHKPPFECADFKFEVPDCFCIKQCQYCKENL